MSEVRLILGDCLDVLPTLGAVDAVVTDPPYGLEFMGKGWDHGIPGVSFWQAVLSALKPGGYLLSFGGARTYHRLACAIEDAGFEIRDCIMWLYGSGFPKGKGCLKPAYEPIIVARRPGAKVLPLGIDACRVPTAEQGSIVRNDIRGGKFAAGHRPNPGDIADYEQHPAGRWPANVAHDGSEEVMEAFAVAGESGGGFGKRGGERQSEYGFGGTMELVGYGDTGTAARFFYTAKASRRERGEGNTHPTVKPLSLMRWLVRLVTPPGGTCLDPFAGSGTTGVACLKEGRDCILIEREAEYHAIAQKRIAAAQQSTPLFAERAMKFVE